MKAIKQFTMALLFASVSAFAQDNSANDDKPIRIGMGIRGNTFSQNELRLRVTPPAKIYANVDIMKYVRVDFQFGYHKNTVHGIFANNYKMDLVDRSLVFASGIFGMYNVDKINFYGGLRFGLISYSNQDYFYYSNSSTPSRITNKGTVGTTFITFGGEYFIHPRFSVAPEFGIGFYKDKYTPGNPGLATAPPKESSKMSGTEVGFVIRFYLL